MNSLFLRLVAVNVFSIGAFLLLSDPSSTLNRARVPSLLLVILLELPPSRELPTRALKGDAVEGGGEWFGTDAAPDDRMLGRPGKFRKLFDVEANTAFDVARKEDKLVSIPYGLRLECGLLCETLDLDLRPKIDF